MEFCMATRLQHRYRSHLFPFELDKRPLISFLSRPTLDASYYPFWMLTWAYSWEKISPNTSITLKQAFYIIADGITIKFQKGGKEVLLDHNDNFWELKYDCDEELEDRKILLTEIHDHFIDSNEIDANSHLDILSKSVTVGQAAWTGIQIIARLIEGLNVSLIEVVTAAFILMAIPTYAYWYRKPYNIGVAKPAVIKIDLSSLPSVPEDSTTADGATRTDQILRPYRAWAQMLRSILESPKEVTQHNDPFTFPGLRWIPPKYQLAVGFTFATIPWLSLTAVHLGAWNYEFPTIVEAWMWRVSCIYLVAGPLLYGFYGIIDHYVETKPDFGRHVPEWSKNCMGACMILLFCIYIVARLFVIVEPFISLRFAPAGIYDKVNWTSYWAHIGPWSRFTLAHAKQ